MKLSLGKIIPIVAVLLIFVLIILFRGSVRINIGEDDFSVRSSNFNVKTSYKDIKSVRLVENIDIGEKVFSSDALTTRSGKFINDEYGEYRLLTYKRNKTYIEIVTEEGTVLFNASKKAQTEYYFEAIKTMIDVKK